MVHPDHPNIESGLLKNLSSPGSAFAITFLFLVFQYTFKLDFHCPCDPSSNTTFCVLYIVFPVFIIFCILTLTAKTPTIVCLGAWTYNCKHNFCKGRCCCCDPCSPTCFYIFKHIMRNVVLSCLWIITVLIDGDVFVCWNLTEVNITSWQNQIPCKEKDKLTPNEFNTFKHHQTISEFTGLSLLFIIPVGWCIFSLCFQCVKNPYKNLYENLYEEKAITLVEMRLQEKAIKSAEDNYSCITELNDLNNLFTYSEGVITLLDKATETSTFSSINSALNSITSKISSITLEFSLIKIGQSFSASEPFSTIPNFVSITSKLILITSELTLINSSITEADSSITPSASSTTPQYSSTSSSDSSQTPSASSTTSEDSSTISETILALTSITCRLTSIISGLTSITSAPSLITSKYPFTTTAFISITSKLSSIDSDLMSISSKLSAITTLPSLEISLTISALSLITSNLSSFTADLTKFTSKLENFSGFVQSSTSATSSTATAFFSRISARSSKIKAFFSKKRAPSTEGIPLLPVHDPKNMAKV